jgi:hypothetical protein
VTVAKGLSPHGKYAITAHGEGDLGYDNFHIFLTDAVTGRSDRWRRSSTRSIPEPTPFVRNGQTIRRMF